jgi:hypothetical protein
LSTGDQFSGGAVCRSSITVNPFGNSNNFGSGSAKIRFVTVKRLRPDPRIGALRKQIESQLGEVLATLSTKWRGVGTVTKYLHPIK